MFLQNLCSGLQNLKFWIEENTLRQTTGFLSLNFFLRGCENLRNSDKDLRDHEGTGTDRIFLRYKGSALL